MVEDSGGPARGELTRVNYPQSYILVVDDEEIVRGFLTRCLTEGGFETREADSAAQALELMVDRPASVVLCDIRMPGQDGLWLAERLRAHWPGTPVVMATAIDDFQTLKKSQQIGVVDYISKPIKPDQLLQVIRRVLTAAQPQEKPATEETAASPETSRTDSKAEAEYTLESPVRCSACGERISTLKAVRLIRAQVNFTSTLPRRGRVIVCPHCLAVIPAELTNF